MVIDPVSPLEAGEESSVPILGSTTIPGGFSA
jgi:hypothetical protein